MLNILVSWISHKEQHLILITLFKFTKIFFFHAKKEVGSQCQQTFQVLLQLYNKHQTAASFEKSSPLPRLVNLLKREKTAFYISKSERAMTQSWLTLTIFIWHMTHAMTQLTKGLNQNSAQATAQEIVAKAWRRTENGKCGCLEVYPVKLWVNNKWDEM